MRAAVVVISALGWLGIGVNAGCAGAPDLAGVLACDDAVGRMRLLVPLVKELGAEEVPAGLKGAIAGHGPGREDAIDALSGRWVELDAAAAIAFARQTTDREAKSSLETAYYGALAERDTEAALKAANQADAGERANAIWQIAHKIGRSDPPRANDLIKSIHASKQEDSDYFIFWNWAGKDLAQANEALLLEAKTAGYSYPCETVVWAMTDRLLEDNPKVAAGWVGELPAGKIHDEAFDRLLSEWETVDRDAVAAWLASLPDSDAVRNAFLNLPKTNEGATPLHIKVDPAFARKAEELDKILMESNTWLQMEKVGPFVDGLSAAEFPEVLEQLRNAPDSNRERVMDALAVRWWKVDAAGAMKSIPRERVIHDMDFSERFSTDMYAAWSEREPEAAYSSATKDDHWVGDWRVLQVLFTAFAKKDPEIAYSLLRKLNDANSQTLVTPIFTEWAVHDLPAATKALEQEPHWQGAIEGIVSGLMRKGPAAAITWAGHLPDQARRGLALRDVADYWPDDPEAAMAWLEKSAAFDGKDSALDDVAVDWAVRDPVEALGHALALPDGKEKDSLLSWGLGQMTYDDAEAAARFAQQISDDATRKRALGIVMAYWSEYDPAGAATYLSSNAAAATPDEVASIVQSMSDGEPGAAVHWLDSLPASVDKAPAIAKIAENWHRTDAPGAEAWVKKMPVGPLYDAGARGICEAFYGDLEPALKWARTIHDAKIRHDAIYQAFERATYARVKFMDLSGSADLKDEIGKTTELTDVEKKALIARLPTLNFNIIAQPPMQKPQIPAPVLRE